MSVVDGSYVIVGESATPANNFKISAPDDGTLLIQKNPSSPTTVATIDANGIIWGGRVLGYVEVTASQTGVNSTTPVDATGLAVTVSVVSGQRVKITGFCPIVTSSVGTDSIGVRIVDSVSGMLSLSQVITPSSGGNSVSVFSVDAPSAGSHTYKLTYTRESGGGSVAISASATFPAFILVEAL